MQRRSLKKGFFEKALNIILDVLIFLFGFILLISIYNNIQVKLLNNRYSSFFGYSVFEVQTGSMAGTIEAGDWIVVKYSKTIHLDDIITFEQNGEFITHRVLEAYNGTYITKGDANNAKDDAITQEQVVGKVIRVLPNFGIVRMTLLNPVVLIALIVTIYSIMVIFKNRKGVQQSTNKKRTDDSVWEMDGFMGSIIKKIKRFITDRFLGDDHFVFDEEDLPKNTEKRTRRSSFEEEFGDMLESRDFDSFEERKEEIKTISSDTVEMKEEPAEVKSEVSKEELDKTIYFRMISVDQEDIDEANGEALTEEEDEEQEEVVQEKQETVVENSSEKVDELQTQLDLLQKKKKKCKNVLQKVMLIKNEELNKILNILNQNEKNKPNEATIRETLLKIYIDGKYYNYCGDVNVQYNGRNMATRVAAAIGENATKMIKKYKGSDKKYAEKVEKYANFFNVIIYLEQTFLQDLSIDEKRAVYETKILKYLRGQVYDGPILKDMISQILKVQKLHSGMIRFVLEKMETNMFELEYTPLTQKKAYAVELKHNLTFSKVYSDYIVEKSYNDGIVAEDKLTVLITLLLGQITKDMLAADYHKKYLFYIPESLYDKENKLHSTFDSFQDEYAKTSIIILLPGEVLLSHKKLIRSLIKEGYHFAVDLGDASQIKAKDQGCIELMEYIFVDRKNKKTIVASLSKESQSKVLLDDIKTKVGIV